MNRIPVLAASLALCGTFAFAESPGKPGLTPIQAELVGDIHARVIKPGASVFARVLVDWHGTDCDLDTGAILEAHVISVVPRSKTTRDSEIDLAFTRAQCGEIKLHPYELMLAAMAAPPQDSDMGILSDPTPLATVAGGGRGPTGPIAALKTMQFSATSMRFDSQISQFPMVPHMKMGDVFGIKGLKLNVPTGKDNLSVLTMRDHDVALERHTLMLLVPANGTYPRAAANPNAANSTSANPDAAQPASATAGLPADGPAPVPQAPDEDTEVCAPPDCNVALPAGSNSELGNAAASISIHDLGYAPRPQRVINDFEHDEALAWLGPRELLVAFNPHTLATRHVLGRSGPSVRVIRATLIDTETRRVTRTLDWELADEREFLWPMEQGRVLVHAGSELRIYGAGLKLQGRIPLDGPLDFVRITPDAGFIAVGVLHERHTPELHAQLRESLNADPEEDVEIMVLNRNLETIARSTARSGIMAPTLLKEGQAKLLAQPNMRYRVSMLTWDNRASTIARFTSSCKPELSSIGPDLLFLVSCNKQTEGREYRVLHTNGKLALKGDPTLNDCGHAAEGSADQKDFVVKTVQSSLPMPPGALFSANDFTSEELGVYRAADGKRLLGVRVGSPSSSRDGYALAADGSQLAVLTREQIALYSVPQK